MQCWHTYALHIDVICSRIVWYSENCRVIVEIVSWTIPKIDA